MPDPDPEPRTPKPDTALRAALDRVAAGVDWPAFGRRLQARVAAERPRRSPWVVAAVGLRLAAAVMLVALGVGLWTAFREAPSRPAAPPPLAARDKALNDLLAQLPAAGVDETWIESRVRMPI